MLSWMLGEGRHSRQSVALARLWQRVSEALCIWLWAFKSSDMPQNEVTYGRACVAKMQGNVCLWATLWSLPEDAVLENEKHLERINCLLLPQEENSYSASSMATIQNYIAASSRASKTGQKRDQRSLKKLSKGQLRWFVCAATICTFPVLKHLLRLSHCSCVVKS